MKNISDLITGLLIIIFSIVCFNEIQPISPEDFTDPLGPNAFPKAILTLLIFFSCVLIYNSFKHGTPKKDKKTSHLKVFYTFIALSIVYMLFFVLLEYLFGETNISYLQDYVAFIISTASFLITSFYLLGRRKFLEIIIIAISVPSFIAFIFSYFFNVILP